VRAHEPLLPAGRPANLMDDSAVYSGNVPGSPPALAVAQVSTSGTRVNPQYMSILSGWASVIKDKSQYLSSVADKMDF
jgi:hypothetical protein